MSTLCCPFVDEVEFQDTNKVKLSIKEKENNSNGRKFF